jgi:hypothetical protein
VLDQLSQMNNNFQLLLSQMQAQMQLQMQMFVMSQGQAQLQSLTRTTNSVPSNPAKQAKQPKKLSSITVTDPVLLGFRDRVDAIKDKGRYHRAFVKKYKLLLCFKQVHGHVRVTAGMHKVLSAWVKNQRTNLGAMSRYKGPLVGRPFHVELLNDVGVVAYDEEVEDEMD